PDSRDCAIPRRCRSSRSRRCRRNGWARSIAAELSCRPSLRPQAETELDGELRKIARRVGPAEIAGALSGGAQCRRVAQQIFEIKSKGIRAQLRLSNHP